MTTTLLGQLKLGQKSLSEAELKVCILKTRVGSLFKANSADRPETSFVSCRSRCTLVA